MIDGLLALIAKQTSTDSDGDTDAPSEVMEYLREYRLLAPMIPAQYGGLGQSHRELAELCDHLGGVNTSIRTLVTGQSAVASAIARWGTDVQRERWLPGLASGRTIAALAFSELGAGSDLASVAARLIRDGLELRLEANKMWVSMGGSAELFLVLAVGPNGLTTVLFPTADGSITRTSRRSSLGMRGVDLADIAFDNVQVPALGSVLGAEGYGLSTVVQTALDIGRLCVGSGAVGIIRSALSKSIDHSTAREQFGRPLSSNQLVQKQIATMAVDLCAAEALVDQAAIAFDDGSADRHLRMWMAKYYATEKAAEASRLVIAIHGAAGVGELSPFADALGDSIISTLIEGSSSIAETVIANMTIARRVGRNV